MLTATRLRELLAYDSETGEFTQRIAYVARANQKHLGMFDTPEEAHAAVVEFKARKEN